MKRKILMPIGDGSEVLDTFYAYYRLPEDGYEVVVAGPDVRAYHTVMHQVPADSAIPWDITREQPGYLLEASAAFRDLDASQFAGAFVSGGRAPEYLRYDEALLRLIQDLFRQNKPVACLCHGIEILTAADCIRGKYVTTVPKCALDVQQGGATYTGSPFVVDGRLVTGQGYQDNTEVLRAFVQLLREAHSPANRG